MVCIKTIVTLSLAGFLFSGPLLAQDPKKVVIGVTNLRSVNIFPLIIARDFGYFKAHPLRKKSPAATPRRSTACNGFSNEPRPFSAAC
jgi:ABC-type nitrate/sulfonate/bicarbonate transport system substrate-binding protein